MNDNWFQWIWVFAAISTFSLITCVILLAVIAARLRELSNPQVYPHVNQQPYPQYTYDIQPH